LQLSSCGAALFYPEFLSRTGDFALVFFLSGALAGEREMKQREINLRQLLKCNKEAFDSLHFHSTHHSAIGNRLALIEHDLPISNQQQKTEKISTAKNGNSIINAT